jgi:Ca2+-binding RTX toxin-like protein
LLLSVAACGNGQESEGNGNGDADAEVSERSSGKTASLALITECAFDSVKGDMTVTVQTTERAVVARRSDGALTVNGSACKSATANNVKHVIILENPLARGDETVTLDMTTGFFALGSSTGAGIRIDLGTGNDTVLYIAREIADTVVAGAGGVSVNGDTFKDYTLTNTGTLQYQFTLHGGNDVFSAQGDTATGAVLAAKVLVYGGLGDDKVTGGAGADKLYGDEGNDWLKGGAGNDTCEGGTGDDTFDESRPTTGSNGNDVYTDSAGSADKVDYSTRTGALVVDIEDAATGTNDDGETAMSEADQLDTGIDIVLAGAGNDTLSGDANANTLSGGAGNDTLTGGDGNDTLNGDLGDDLFKEDSASNGADVLNGGAGSDTVDYGARSADLLVTMSGNVANDGQKTPAENDNVKSDIEHCIAGSGDDDVTGNTADNTLTGGDGADVLRGDSGADRFLEGATANGGDTFIGGAGYDTVDYSARSQALSVTIAAGSDDGESGENDNLTSDVEVCNGGSANDTMVGSALADELNGGAGNDTLRGGAGNDTLSGDAGDDSLDGEADDDLLDGGSGTDTLQCGAGSDIGYNGETTLNCEL